jgi:hypothetical protein
MSICIMLCIMLCMDINMVIGTIGKAEVNFMVGILQQILQFGEGRIRLGRLMTAIALVEVLSAFLAQTFAFGLAQRADGNFEQGIFAEELGKVEMRVFGQKQFRLGFGAFVKGVHLGEGPIQFVLKIHQTTYTIERDFCGKIRLHDQALRRLADIDNALEIAQLQVVAEGDGIEYEREIVVVPEFLMDDESDIETKRFFGRRHFIRMNDKG